MRMLIWLISRSMLLGIRRVSMRSWQIWLALPTSVCHKTDTASCYVCLTTSVCHKSDKLHIISVCLTMSVCHTSWIQLHITSVCLTMSVCHISRIQLHVTSVCLNSHAKINRLQANTLTKSNHSYFYLSEAYPQTHTKLLQNFYVSSAERCTFRESSSRCTVLSLVIHPPPPPPSLQHLSACLEYLSSSKQCWIQVYFKQTWWCFKCYYTELCELPPPPPTHPPNWPQCQPAGLGYVSSYERCWPPAPSDGLGSASCAAGPRPAPSARCSARPVAMHTVHIFISKISSFCVCVGVGVEVA